SLHAPNDELRTQVMKINRAFPIDKLMKSIEYYLSKKNRRITFEYILLKDVNDHPKEAHELEKLLQSFRHLAYVNLIPYNTLDKYNTYNRINKQKYKTV